jgi:hypothetical protein
MTLLIDIYDKPFTCNVECAAAAAADPVVPAPVSDEVPFEVRFYFVRGALAALVQLGYDMASEFTTAGYMNEEARAMWREAQKLIDFDAFLGVFEYEIEEELAPRFAQKWLGGGVIDWQDLFIACGWPTRD